uniref:G protein-coupled receptor n=1 Tax=Caenorhabditis tropicalis TaxID=1561998 RepID=A0A1I7T909_9PELO
MSSMEMSLFYVITNDFEMQDLYKCPQNMSSERIPRPYVGSYFLISGIALILIYLPCFIAMIRSKCRAPSYQLMIILGIFDLLSLTVNSVITGIMGIMGVSFCHYPLFTFCAGSIALGSWMGACVCCILMALDRCVEINSHFPLAILFHKPVFRFVMIAIICFWCYTTFFTKPILFTAQYMCWFFDPNIGFDASLYHNIPHTINNLLVAVISTPLYIYLCYHLIFKFGYTTSMWQYKTKYQIVIQAVILCSFHAAAAYIYVYMQFFPSPPWLIIIGQLAWQWSNGCVCIAYWTLNRSIRNAAIRMMLSRRFRQRFKLHMGIDEAIAVERGEDVKSVTTNIVAIMGNTAKVAPFLNE